MASVVSAAVISGELIIGLDDGSIIRAGYVQGPQGLKGDQGPQGATGGSGEDGNTLHTVEGTPDGSLGKDGDYAINRVEWRIHGPKAGGRWPQGVDMLAKGKSKGLGGKGSGGNGIITGGGSQGGGPGGDVYTNTVLASGTGRLAESPIAGTPRVTVSYGGSPNGIIPPRSGMAYQSNINAFFVDALDQLDLAMPVARGDSEPTTDIYDGKLWYNSDEEHLTLYVRYNGQWVPAAPPVSTEGLENNVSLLNEAVQLLQATASSHTLQIADAQSTQVGLAKLAGQNYDSINELQTSQAGQDTKIDALEASQAVQDNQIIELEEEIESLAPSLDRGKWNLAELGAGVTLASGEYAMGIGVDSVYCQEKYLECVANANNDPFLMSECTRLVGECETAKDNGQEFFINDWAHANFLHFHKTDSEGKTHTFNDYEVGMFIDLFDQGDTGYAVFEITEAPTLDGDVYTIGVHPVQHEGEAAGLARVKVFELAGSDPTEYVRKSGDTMSGRLWIKPPKDTAGLYIYPPQGDAGAGTDENLQLVRIANSSNAYVFYVENGGAIAGKQGMVPTDPRHLVPKSYVDKEFTAPARLEWKVFINLDGTPQQGLAYLDGASIGDTAFIRLHLQPANSTVKIKGHSAGLTMYKYSPSPKLYHANTLSAWHYSSSSGGSWTWKGSAEIDEIKLFADYIEIKLGSRKWSNMNFTNTGSYRFTIGGLF